MNNCEKQMLAILRRGKAEGGFVAVKAEFEAEGTRTDELLRLLEIARRADLKVGLKIGGCEAVRDLIEARQFGVDYVIAPMVETPYALSKYIAAKNNVFNASEYEDVRFLFNVETRSTIDHIEELGRVAAEANVGFVFGRVDFAGSMCKDRQAVNSDEMIDYIEKVSSVAAGHGLELVVGGGVSPASVAPLRRIRATRLDRFETRKIIFDGGAVDSDTAVHGMELAIEFELLWLKNKRDYYKTIAAEDQSRIEMMEARQSSSVKAAV